MAPPRRRQPAVLPPDVSRWVLPIHDVDDVEPPVQDREITRLVVFFLQESSSTEGGPTVVAADNELTNRVAVWAQFREQVDQFAGLRMEVRPFENTPGDRVLELWEAPPLLPEEMRGLRRAGLYVYLTDVAYRFPRAAGIFRLPIADGRSFTVREMLAMIREHRMQDFWFEHRPEGPRRFIGHRDFWMQFFIRLLERRIITGELAEPEGVPETPRPATAIGVLTRRWFPDGESAVLPIENGRFPRMVRWTTPSMQYLSELNLPRPADSDADTEMAS